MDQFSEKDLVKIEAATREAEKNTSGEVRVVIRSHYDEDLEGNLHEQTKRDFLKHGLDKTRDKTGVIVLLVLAAKRFMIWGDDGIHAKVPQGYWDMLAVGISAHFKEERYVQGVCEAVDEVGKRLAEFFPKKLDDVDELPNKPIVED
ncbi:MAG: hypothetical protein A3D92_17875, partial [Bacteroidetes bacterium RIFCSPHIGHO2_02_FULL_44_7]